MWCAARHCAFESHPLRQETPMQIASGFLHTAKPPYWAHGPKESLCRWCSKKNCLSKKQLPLLWNKPAVRPMRGTAKEGRSNKRHKQLIPYKMEFQISYRVRNSILNNTDPVIYRKGKVMYHLNLPYRKMCDSDYFSIVDSNLNKTGLGGYKMEDPYFIWAFRMIKMWFRSL